MTKTSPSKDSPILIVGAGAFGLATAHSLVLAGYTNVTVLERDCQVPSRFSGGFDLNKMVRAEYADPFYTPIALVNLWRVWDRAGSNNPGRKRFESGNRILCTSHIFAKLAY